MKFVLLTAAAAAALISLSGSRAVAHDDVHISKNVIIVSCFRGPWKEIIVDRASLKFVDSLVDAGYSRAQAQAVGDRICRDPKGIDSADGLAEVTTAILGETRGH